MAESAFDHVCEGIERGTALDRLQSRGTVRLALKEAGLEPARVQPAEMAVVLRRVLPAALRSRGVENAEAVCEALALSVARLESSAQPDSPDAVFRRLAG